MILDDPGIKDCGHDTNADGGMKSFKVYLKDAAGNKGKVTQIKNKNAGKTSLPVD